MGDGNIEKGEKRVRATAPKRNIKLWITIFVLITMVLASSGVMVYLYQEGYMINKSNGREWEDMDRFKDDMKGEGYKVSSTTTLPRELPNSKPEKNLFIILQPSPERIRYRDWELDLLKEYIDRGAKLIYTSFDGKGMSHDLKGEVNFYGETLYDNNFDFSPIFPLVDFTLGSNNYTVMLSDPSGIWTKPNEPGISVIGNSSDESYIDLDGNDVIDIMDIQGPITCGVTIGSGSRIIMSNGAPFTNDLYNEEDNKEFINDLVRRLLPSGGHIIFEESTHSSKRSPYPSFSSSHHGSIPLRDDDRDGLPDILERYKYGTDMNDSDTDDDGMDDLWEVVNGLDPNDPMDMYDDPDNDGYDLDGSGEIEHYEDAVYMSDMNAPKASGYELVTLNDLLADRQTYDQELIRIDDVEVLENGVYMEFKGAGYGFETRLYYEKTTCTIVLTVTDNSTMSKIDVCVEISGNRPIDLRNNTFVDLQGVFRHIRGVSGDIVVRGGEAFTNIMEYSCVADYDNDGVVNQTSPIDPDTDDDGMSDGWEIAYGEGSYNYSLSPPRWKWTQSIDPTWDGDALIDLDGDGMTIGGELRGYNLDEFNYGSDPTRQDTDRDSFDVNRDGHTPDDRNAIDTAEIFLYNSNPKHWDSDGDRMSDGWEIWYGLNATDPSDLISDPDGDLLVNLDEFMKQTHPRKWDTDGDGMPDGWEVENDLRPLDQQDGDLDWDRDYNGYMKHDGLTNLQEYLNGTDPTDWDTDDDNMSDGWEVQYGLNATDPMDASDDPDGDGFSNLDEFCAETDPTDETSHP